MEGPSLGDYLTEAQRKKLSKGQLKKLAKRERLERLERDRARRAAKRKDGDGYIPIAELAEMARKLDRLERGFFNE